VERSFDRSTPMQALVCRCCWGISRGLLDKLIKFFQFNGKVCNGFLEAVFHTQNDSILFFHSCSHSLRLDREVKDPG
jgi:hypothetical protein